MGNLLTRWAYNDPDSNRDLRIDFMRGIVMMVMIVVHIEIFSLYDFLAWERIGLIAGAEGFVILAGFVLGMVYRKRIITSGWRNATSKLVSRAFLLYCINISIIVSIYLLSFIPFLNTQQVMTFTDRGAKKTYPLYPVWFEKIEEQNLFNLRERISPEKLKLLLPFIDKQYTKEDLTTKLAAINFSKEEIEIILTEGYPHFDIRLQTMISQTLALKIRPHQSQVLGLYIFLLLFSPIALFLLVTNRTRHLIWISWAIYIYNNIFPSMPTGAQFEYAFPLLTWQLIFFHGMAFGYHRNRITEFMKGPFGKPVMILCYVLFFGFFFLAQNHTNPFMPSYAKIHIIKPEIFNMLYFTYFKKNTLGILRLLNYFVVIVVVYSLLSRFWQIFNKFFGWFFIPMGQSALYVFIIHVYIVMAASNFVPFNFSSDHMLLNTLVHTICLLVIWIMVKKKILFNVIPR